MLHICDLYLSVYYLMRHVQSVFLYGLRGLAEIAYFVLVSDGVEAEPLV